MSVRKVIWSVDSFTAAACAGEVPVVWEKNDIRGSLCVRNGVILLAFISVGDRPDCAPQLIIKSRLNMKSGGVCPIKPSIGSVLILMHHIKEVVSMTVVVSICDEEGERWPVDPRDTD